MASGRAAIHRAAPRSDPTSLPMRRLLLLAVLALVPSVAHAQVVRVTLSEWKVRLSRDTVTAGQVTFEIANNGQIAHAVQVVGNGVDKATRQLGAKEVATLTVTLKPGTYEVICPLAEDSHKQAGMHRTLVVIAPPGSP